MDSLVVKEPRTLWLGKIKNLVASGMTQKAWRQREGIPVTTLRYWIRKLRIRPEEVISSKTGDWLELTSPRQTSQASLAEKNPRNTPTMVLRTDSFALEFYEKLSPTDFFDYVKVLVHR